MFIVALLHDFHYILITVHLKVYLFSLLITSLMNILLMFSEGFRFPFEMSQSLDLIPITSNIKWFCFIQLDVNSKVFVLDINLLKIIPTNLNYLNSIHGPKKRTFFGVCFNFYVFPYPWPFLLLQLLLLRIYHA